MRKKETFILSLWVEEGETALLRGMLQSVKSGEKQAFTTIEELLVLIRARLQQIETPPLENEIVEKHGD